MMGRSPKTRRHREDERGSSRRRRVDPLLLLVAATAACAWEHDVPVEMEFFDAIDPDVRAFALVVYEMDECPDASGFDLDANASLILSEQFFRGAEGEPVGSLDPGEYAFVGLALDTSCVPLHFGCEQETFEEQGFWVGAEAPVGILMESTEDVEGLGAVCRPGTSCADGVCEAP